MAYYNNIPNLYPSAVPYGNNKMNEARSDDEREKCRRAIDQLNR